MRSNIPGILSEFPSKTVLVLGDVMLDEFIWGTANRISPEAPVPVVAVERASCAPGGAANAAMNIAGLRARALLAGVLGDDEQRVSLLQASHDGGVITDGMLTDPQRPTTVKTRIIAHGRHVVRTDRETRAPINGGMIQRLGQYAERVIGDVDAVLISDYNKGVAVPSLLSEVIQLARSRGKPVVVDPKGAEYARYRKATMVTPNINEAAQATGLEISDHRNLQSAGWALLEQVESEAVLITRGEEGMSLFERGGKVTHLPAVSKAVFDVTGAGDTVAATCVLALACGGDFIECAILANRAAGIVVAKVGTARVTLDELRDRSQPRSWE